MSSAAASSMCAAIARRLLPDLVERHHQRRAADRQPAAAHRAVALRGVGRVAVVDDDLVEVGAEVVGDDLGEGRLLPLAVRRDAGEDRDLAARLDAHGRALARPEAADLDVGGEADAEVAALLRGPAPAPRAAAS